ncbi:MAG: AAA family ATPase [Gracilibacteraceae bacterium]|jgi:chromosomal replication initiator protein|nr:AAA family ATPase [Gracilibacteraceae bacterium]
MYVSQYNGLCYNVLNSYDPAFAPNILLLRGCAGSGKTALLKHLLRKLEKICRVSFLDSAAFARKFAFLLHKGNYGAWRKELRASQVLLIDDIHALSGKRKTLDEMFYTMNDVISRGGKMVVTASDDRYSPEALGVRLGSNLATALSFTIKDASVEEKERFLHYYSQRKGVSLKNMADLPIADMSFKAIALAVDGYAAGEPFVLRELGQAYKQVLAALAGVTHDDVIGRGKKEDVVLARRVICYRLTGEFGFTYKDVALFLGHTVNCVRQRCRAYTSQAGGKETEKK